MLVGVGIGVFVGVGIGVFVGVGTGVLVGVGDGVFVGVGVAEKLHANVTGEENEEKELQFEHVAYAYCA